MKKAKHLTHHWCVRLLRLARPRAGGTAAVCSLTLATVVFDVFKPWPLKLLVDYALPHKPLPAGAAWIVELPSAKTPDGLVFWLAGGTVLLFLAHQATNITRGYALSGVTNHLVYDLGARVFGHLQRLSLLYHGRRPTGDSVRRVLVDCGCVRDLVGGVFLSLVTSVLTIVAMFAVMWQLDATLSLIALVVAPPLGWLIHRLARPMEERAYQQQQLEGELMALAEQTLTTLPLVQAFGREDYGDRRFRRLSRLTVQAFLRATAMQLQFKVGTGAITAAGTAVIMLIGGLHVLHGSLQVGSLLIFLSYLTALYAPMETLAYLSSSFASAAGGARRVLEVLDVPEDVQQVPNPTPLPPRPVGERGHIRMENVTFGYEPGLAALKDITLEARPGETLALVGHTGAGKSTLVSLIPRFFDPWQGRVTFDGVDVRHLPLQELRAQVALVLQEPFLLPLSVAANIAYGRPDAERGAIEAAAQAANAHHFIERLPQGYDTVIGERGATLSGGERQRLAIARALLKDSPVLILDEPTSALDAHTEALLLEALERLMVGRTTFIIAHRLSTIRRADRIVVLEGGEIVEQGSHPQLLAAHGAYHCLYHSQFRESGWKKAGVAR